MTIYLGTLDGTTPKGSGTDGQRKDGHIHIKTAKSAWLNSFPAVTAPVTPDHSELNHLVGCAGGLQALFGQSNDTGGDEDYSATLGDVTTYFDGLRVTLKITTAMTSAPTLTVNALAAIPIVDMFGDAAIVPAGAVVRLIYYNTNFYILSDH